MADEGPELIEGTVFYEDGRPAEGATVSALPLDRGLIGKAPSADTDELGRFQINHLWLGKFGVTAEKEDEGYPDVSSNFYADIDASDAGQLERGVQEQQHRAAKPDTLRFDEAHGLFPAFRSEPV